MPLTHPDARFLATVVRLSFLGAAALLLSSCGSGSVPNELENEVLRVQLDDSTSYEWRVRALTENAPGPWSDGFLLEQETGDREVIEVSYIVPEQPTTESLHNLLFNDESEQTIVAGSGEFSGIPMFSWSHVENAAGYEIEISKAEDSQRVGIYQYAQNALCINDVCELIVENAGAESVDLPPIAVLEQTVVQGEAPYTVNLQSPVLNAEQAKSLTHEWSIEGRYVEFPALPSFSHSFSDVGSHVVNVLVSNDAGQSGYARAIVEISPSDAVTNANNQQSVIPTASTNASLNLESNEEPDAAAALPESIPESLPLEVSEADLIAPEVSVHAPTESIASGEQIPGEEYLPSNEVVANEGNVTEINGAESIPIATTETAPEVALTVANGSPGASEEESNSQASVDQIAQIDAGISGNEVDSLVEQSTQNGTDEVSPTTEESLTQIETETQESATEAPVGVDSTTVVHAGPVPEIVDLEDADTLVFDDGLRMGGLFYGHPGSGYKTANAPIALQSSRRFMAERSGDIVSIRHFNRTLLNSDIEGRCSASNPDSVWCKCKNAGLDRFSCGYTLSNSYTVGNGGTIVVEIRADDGTEDHAPSDVVLGTSAQPFVPLEIASEYYPEIELAEPVTLEAGKLYHIVYRNINPPTSCSLRGVSISEAASCPRDQGAMGLDGVSHQVDVGPTARFGPFYGNSPAVLYRSSDSSDWRTSSTVTSWYEVKYDDDVWLGDSLVAFDAHIGDGKKTIDGDVRARQVFTVTDASRTVDGMWLNFGQRSWANGDSLLVELKSESGLVLASGNIARSDECLSIVVNAENSFERACRAWGFTDFSSNVDLLVGSTYTVELSAESGAGFLLSTYFTLKHYGSNDSNHWDDAYAEISTDGGNDWDSWVDSFLERDIPLLFTVEGQPRQIR